MSVKPTSSNIYSMFASFQYVDSVLSVSKYSLV